MYERLVVAGAIHVAESERHGSGKNRDTLKNAANRFLQLTNSLGIASASERAPFWRRSVDRTGIRKNLRAIAGNRVNNANIFKT